MKAFPTPHPIAIIVTFAIVIASVRFWQGEIVGGIQVIGGTAIVIMAFYILYKGTVKSNLRKIQSWILNMDVNSNGQRYRGNGATLVCTLLQRRHGAFGYEIRNLYATRSYRYFILHVQSEFSSITGWSIEALTMEQADEIANQAIKEYKASNPGQVLPEEQVNEGEEVTAVRG